MTTRFYAYTKRDESEWWEVRITRESLRFYRYLNWGEPCVTSYISDRYSKYKSGPSPKLREPREIMSAMLLATLSLPEELVWRVFGMLEFDLSIRIHDVPRLPFVDMMQVLRVSGRFDENGNLRPAAEFDRENRGPDMVL